jgi:hypothetical protein
MKFVPGKAETIANPYPRWDKNQDGPSSVEAVYEWTIRNAWSQYNWYARKKGYKRRGSQFIRMMAVALAAIGALCPLLDATDLMVNWVGDPIKLGQWGYVFLAMAGALVSYDRFFGLSSGWMRYILTQLEIERAIKVLHYDWSLYRSADKADDPANVQAFLQRAKDFTTQIEALVKQETDAWVLEFQTNLSQLEKSLKAETEARKPGSVKVTVPNARSFDRVEVRLNGVAKAEMVGVVEAMIPAVPPGQYRLSATGMKAGQESEEARVVEVHPGNMLTVDMTLP